MTWLVVVAALSACLTLMGAVVWAACQARRGQK